MMVNGVPLAAHQADAGTGGASSARLTLWETTKGLYFTRYSALSLRGWPALKSRVRQVRMYSVPLTASTQLRSSRSIVIWTWLRYCNGYTNRSIPWLRWPVVLVLTSIVSRWFAALPSPMPVPPRA